MKQGVRIRVSRETRGALKALKRGGETYDDVIRRLMKFWDLAEEQIPKVHLEKLQAQAGEAEA